MSLKYIWIFLSILFVHSISIGQTDLGQINNIDQALLNTFIVQEVNKYRKKAKVDPVVNNAALNAAAADHANYMQSKRKLTHKQRKRIKRSPKNRVDFYGEKFNRLGENVQLNNLNISSAVEDKKNPRIHTYEALAKALVLSWKNSPPHYKNMIAPDFKTTYTAVSINDDGEVFACQLFGGSMYKDKYESEKDSVYFKPDRSGRCWRCKFRPPAGAITVTDDSLIVFTFVTPRFLGIIPIPAITYSRMRFFNPWTDGLAADIIVKSQYTCDSNSYHNGISNVRGIPLPPVYKKDYMGIGIYGTSVVLGKVPEYLDEEFEVNLIVIQNKRPCSNTMYNVIPSDFHVDIPLDYDFEPSDAVLKKFALDTLSKRIVFDKSLVLPSDSTHSEFLLMAKEQANLIERIELTGFASIEGSTENNINLYKDRANYLLERLTLLGIDSSKVFVTTAENFAGFRKDVMGTKFEYLAALSNEELKEKVSKTELSDSLEFIFKNHRYVDLSIITRQEYEVKYDQELTNQKLQKAIDRGNLSEAIEMQRVQYSLALAGKMDINDIALVEIPKEKKHVKLLHNKAVMRFLLDSINISSLESFRADLVDIIKLKESDKRLNTSIAIIDYHLYSHGFYRSKKYNFYDTIRKRKYIDPVQRARILLNVASSHDWTVWQLTGSYNQKKYWYKKAKRYVKPARLNVNKTFEIASYYSFFWQHKYAYTLTKGKIDDTENPYDLIFFLKLIHLTDVKLPRNKYLGYFKKIQKYGGEDFCSFFNNPALNFQIFDDEEIKEIYCHECAND